MIRLLLAALLLLPAAASAQPATVIIVRHAEKASNEADPVLSDIGTQRAKDLAAALVDAKIGSIFITQFKRTHLTAADVAAARGLTPTIIPAGAPTHATNIAAEVMKRPPGEVVLVVGHSNTVNLILAALGGPKLGNICDSQYANMFIVELRPGAAPSVVRSKYGAADPADPSCASMRE